jgi:hypothetical protein
MGHWVICLVAVMLAALSTDASARTVYRCVQGGVVSLATAPEPGSKCEAKEIDDQSAATPNPWGSMGVVQGRLYRREQDGRTVYSTRELPGSVEVLAFTVKTPEAEPAHLGLGRIGPPRLDQYPKQFVAAAKATGVDDALLRAIAHAESAFDPKAVSSKGARGVMQLLPETAREYGVKDPFNAGQSISAGARHMKTLMKLYEGDVKLATAAYNAGAGAVTRYGGVPPYQETREYVEKVAVLYARYREALGEKL